MLNIGIYRGLQKFSANIYSFHVRVVLNFRGYIFLTLDGSLIYDISNDRYIKMGFFKNTVFCFIYFFFILNYLDQNFRFLKIISEIRLNRCLMICKILKSITQKLNLLDKI